ncbi:hypothetical protein ACSYAD_21455 [Acaryochloris marina NIES-2412]|uniref:hypothetical protein n=1 Tax=Acaryochloris marina TaxID=155978 RepID=UPI004059BA10
MPLLDDVRILCSRLAPLGWRDLLLTHGLDITATNLAEELRKPLPNFDSRLRGFEDFAITFSPSGVVPGNPAKSLLYHAFASANVMTTPEGEPQLPEENYPTLSELDTLENYIYSLNRQLPLDGLVIAVFAYQYRIGARSTHREHADIAFSRTGVARVGTQANYYQRFRRSFWVEPKKGNGISVMPARYGAFLARVTRPSDGLAIQGGHDGANDEFYLKPVHKLFDGDECLEGRNIELSFLEYHRNEKLQKVHAQDIQGEGGIPLPSEFNANTYPFVRDSNSIDPLVKLERQGASCLVVPIHHPHLVRSTQQTTPDGEKIVYFRVPPQTNFRSRDTRFITSLEIPSYSFPSFRQGIRKAPEYLNIRHQVDPNSSPMQTPKDINREPEEQFQRILRVGGYDAAHFIDDSGEGVVAVQVKGYATTPPPRPAYSLVTAPDFFPLSDQIDLIEFSNSISKFTPLSFGRIPVNPSLPFPEPLSGLAFGERDVTLSAIVSDLPIRDLQPNRRQTNIMTSFLPDAASDVFQPGWDVAVSGDDQSAYRAAFGLGSPFPEDAKLCAALSSFWPAVAPDASRTFGNQPFPNFMPMLDDELGYHPRHPKILDPNDVVSSSPGWDGEFGPFFEQEAGETFVNIANIERSDYVSNALAGTISVSKTATIQSNELLARMMSLRQCNQIFQDLSLQPDCLVTAEKVTDWTTRSDRLSNQLGGAGYLYIFADLGREVGSADLKRKRFRSERLYTCQVGDNGITFDTGNGPQFIA